MFQSADTHRLPALLAAVVLSSAALVLSPSAVAMLGGNEPCVAANGQTLDEVYGASASIISPDCNRMRAGEQWSPSVPLVMNTRFETVPPGFATDSATPLDDFRNKFRNVRYVVDREFPQLAYNRSFPAGNNLWVGELPESPGIPAGLPAVNTLSLGALDPLPVGRHIVEVYWDLAAQFCDGFAANEAVNCLPAGETLVRRMYFYVDPR